MIELRPYQLNAIAEAERHKRSVIVAPTGSGKTIIAAEMIRRATDKHVLYLAHRRELIHQARDKLAELGVMAGVILAGEARKAMASVQVASIQTLWSRCVLWLRLGSAAQSQGTLRRSSPLSGSFSFSLIGAAGSCLMLQAAKCLPHGQGNTSAPQPRASGSADQYPPL